MNNGHDGWKNEARKVGGDQLVGLLEELVQGQKEIQESLGHMKDFQSTATADLIALKAAFPAGDLDGHRRYHELIIEGIAERRKLRMAIQEKTISALVWLFVAWVGTAIWSKLVGGLAGALALLKGTAQ